MKKEKTFIPRIIHQIWLGPLTPPKRAMSSWRVKHAKWEYRYWTEKNMPMLTNQEAFDKSEKWTQKSDILRYELLYKYGGVYIDSDEHCLRPIDSLIDSVEEQGMATMAAREGDKARPDMLANGVLASEKGNPFMLRLIEELNVDQPDKMPWEVSGPLYFSKMIEKYNPDIYRVEPYVFYPGHHTDEKSEKEQFDLYAQNPEVLGIQLWGSTHNRYLPVWYKQPIKFLKHLKIKWDAKNEVSQRNK